jgi:hypothetical protein
MQFMDLQEKRQAVHTPVGEQQSHNKTKYCRGPWSIQVSANNQHCICPWIGCRWLRKLLDDTCGNRLHIKELLLGLAMHSAHIDGNAVEIHEHVLGCYQHPQEQKPSGCRVIIITALIIAPIYQ